jgi:hypothetical protein
VLIGPEIPNLLQVTADCRTKVKVHKFGKVEWEADVRSNETNNDYGVGLHFQDKAVWVWIMPMIWSPKSLPTSGFGFWDRRDLAVAEHLYDTLHSVSRWDDCR